MDLYLLVSFFFLFFFFFFSSRRRHTRCSRDWSSDVCSSDLVPASSTLVLLFMRVSSVGCWFTAPRLSAAQRGCDPGNHRSDDSMDGLVSGNIQMKVTRSPAHRTLRTTSFALLLPGQFAPELLRVTMCL